MNEGILTTIYELSKIFEIEELETLSKDEIISYINNDITILMQYYEDSLFLKFSKEFLMEVIIFNLKNFTSDHFLKYKEDLFCEIFQKNNKVLEVYLLDFSINFYKGNKKYDYSLLDNIDYNHIDLSNFEKSLKNADELLSKIILEKKSKLKFFRKDKVTTVYSAIDILKKNPEIKNGVNLITINNEIFPIYCNFDFEGGGWMLVRRHKVSNSWKDNIDDNLKGNTEWGIIDNNVSPTIDRSFSYKFNHLEFKEFLFMTGDGQKWLICDKSSVYEGWNQNLVKTKIKKSHIMDKPYEAVWGKRNQCPEDPWISAQDHLYKNISYMSDNEEHSMLYGETFKGWTYYLLNHLGCNVWIR